MTPIHYWLGVIFTKYFRLYLSNLSNMELHELIHDLHRSRILILSV